MQTPGEPLASQDKRITDAFRQSWRQLAKVEDIINVAVVCVVVVVVVIAIVVILVVDLIIVVTVSVIDLVSARIRKALI